jgi:5-methylcytosine-specific restriction protein A
MPMRAAHPCANPGCPELIRVGQFCSSHSHIDKQESKRDPKGQKLYKTARWERTRKMQLAKEPWCADCLKEERYTPATDCDHIKPWAGDQTKFFKGPFQSLCHSHHSAKTRIEKYAHN